MAAGMTAYRCALLPPPRYVKAHSHPESYGGMEACHQLGNTGCVDRNAARVYISLNEKIRERGGGMRKGALSGRTSVGVLLCRDQCDWDSQFRFRPFKTDGIRRNTLLGRNLDTTPASEWSAVWRGFGFRETRRNRRLSLSPSEGCKDRIVVEPKIRVEREVSRWGDLPISAFARAWGWLHGCISGIAAGYGSSERKREGFSGHEGQGMMVQKEPGWRWCIARRSMVVYATVFALAVGIITADPLGCQTPHTALALTEESLLFLEAWRTIDRAYVDKSFNGQNWFRFRENALKRTPMGNREETYEAIRQMMATLGDPFTRFLPPDQFKILKSGTQGTVTGVGLEVGFNGGGGNIVVVAPVIGGPAAKAGIVPGDAIMTIDGTPTQGLSLYEAALKLQGEAGTSVVVTVQRNGEPMAEALSLTRERVTLNPVSWDMCSAKALDINDAPNGTGKVGYIYLRSFTNNSPEAVREAIEKLREGGASSFVLDIRNNSGGLFPAVIDIAKLWMEKGVIVYVADSKGIRDVYDTNGNGALATSEPLTVLVNRGTASASEILAGALKDNKRAVILGERTFGKGKIQSVFELSDGSGMSVTIARYKTPGEIDIDQVGITPDGPLPDGVPMDGASFCQCVVEEGNPCKLPSALIPSSN